MLQDVCVWAQTYLQCKLHDIQFCHQNTFAQVPNYVVNLFLGLQAPLSITTLDTCMGNSCAGGLVDMLEHKWLLAVWSSTNPGCCR